MAILVMVIINTLQFITTPSNLIAILFLVALFLSIFKKARRFAMYIASCAILLFFIAGNGPFSYFLLGKLEHHFPPAKGQEDLYINEYIVVLAGYGINDDYYPLTSKINDSSLFRCAEAARLWYINPSAHILLAGPTNATKPMKDLLLAIGLPEHKLLSLPASFNTLGNFHSIKSALNENRFFLVTSAGHMPRAMLLCNRIGLKATPAPTDYYTSPHFLNANWFFSPLHLKCTDFAVNEFKAIIFYNYLK